MSRAPARHNLRTQEGKNRFKKAFDQPELIGLTAEEQAQVDLWRKIQFFPTYPAATRALLEALGWDRNAVGPRKRLLDPCAGRGHMTETLQEYGHHVTAMDIHDHGKGYRVADFLSEDFGDNDALFDAVIMNPPFGHEDDRIGQPTIADRFIAKALDIAPNVFVFARLGFITPGVRYLSMTTTLACMYVFCDRVPVALGRIAKKGGATDYVWLHFARDLYPGDDPLTRFIAPGTLKRLWRKGDDRK